MRPHARASRPARGGLASRPPPGDPRGGSTERSPRRRTLVGGAGGGVELLEGDAATPAAVAQALATMTLASGRRVIIVEGAERWRKDDFERDLAPALDQVPPETTLALFADRKSTRLNSSHSQTSYALFAL